MITFKKNAAKYKDENGNMQDIGMMIGAKSADAVLDASSTNAVQNKVVAEEIGKLSEEKLDLNQGSSNVGKILVVGIDGNLTLTDMPVSVDVIGYIDSNNTIVLTGSLAEGTYTFRYEGTDGTVGDIGTFTVEGDKSVATYTNLVTTSIDSSGAVYNETGYKTGYRLSSSSGSESALDGAICSGFIPFGTATDIIRITGLDQSVNISDSGNYVIFYDSSFEKVGLTNCTGATDQAGYTHSTDEVTGTKMMTIDFSTLTLTTPNGSMVSDISPSYFRVSRSACSDPSTFIVTINEEIV